MNTRLNSALPFILFFSLTLLSPAYAAGSKAVKDLTPEHNMDFWYYVPKQAQTKPSPLVLSYHGAGGTGGGEIKQWIPLADKNGFSIACITSPFAGSNTKAGQNMKITPDIYKKETEAALSVVEFMKKKAKVQEEFVMITGFSGGGNPTHFIGFLNPEVFGFICARCGNYPMMLSRIYDQGGEGEAVLKKTAGKTRVYYFWGEKDHPIILGMLKNTSYLVNPLKFFEKIQVKHLKTEMIPGMGHRSKADKAAQWFMDSIEAVKKETLEKAKKEYPELCRQAKDLVKKKELKEAYELYTKAAEYERMIPGLGKKAQAEISRIDKEAEKLLSKAKSYLRKNRSTVRKYLREVLKDYPMTPAAEESQKLLDSM